MSRTFHHGERRIRVKGIRRKPVDLRRLARALIDLAQAEAEAAAHAEHNSTSLTDAPTLTDDENATNKRTKPGKRGPEAA